MMVRRVSVYDKNGHRIKSKTGNQDEGEKIELPPISSGEGSQHGSASSTSSKNKSPGQNDANFNLCGKDITGILLKGFLSRRKMDNTAGVINDAMVYLPQLRNLPNGSVRTSRSEPLYTGRRLIFEKTSKFNRNPHMLHNLKEFTTDRIVTLVERPDKSQSESLRKSYEYNCIVSESRFLDINDFIEEVARILDVSDCDKYLHSVKYGQIVRHLSELEDGGEYFFGSANLKMSNCDLSTPELIDDEREGGSLKRSAGSRISFNRTNKQWPQKEGGRKRKITVLTNHSGSTGSLSMIIDENSHKTISELCHQIGTQLEFSYNGVYAPVERLVTRSGKTVMTLNEIFLSADDTFVAVIPFDSFYGGSHGWEDPYSRPYGYKYGSVARAMPNINARERMFTKPFEIAVNGKVHVFEPPYTDSNDYPRKKLDGTPLENLEIDWVYGYNGKNCRNNLVLLPSLELVYFVAKVVIILEPDDGKQRFYTEHTDEIRCMTQHPGSWIIATGQVSGGVDKGFQHIRVWDAKSTVTLNVLRFDIMDMSVECLCFSQDDNGLKLAAIANSTDEWKLQVWDWEETVTLSKSSPYTDIELVCAFDPLDSNIVISCGKSHLYFWDVSSNLAQFAPGRFYNYQVPDFVTCLGFNENSELITADSNGYLHKWLSDERKTYCIIKTSHTSSIITMEVLQGDYVVTGGGSDRMLCLTNCDNEEIEPTIGKVEIGENYGGIIAISPVKNDFVGTDFENMKLVLGTSMNTILCGTPADGDFECVVSGPSNEITSLKAHPSENMFIICGVDSYVTLCIVETRKELWELKLGSKCTSASFSPDGKTIAIGCSDGSWVELNTIDGYQNGLYKTETSEVTSVAYSPNGQYVAVGLESGAIYWYHCQEDSQQYRYISSVKVLQEAITSIDWSTSGSHLRFCTLNYDFEIWNMDKRRVETNEVILRDIQFATETCALHYYTAGIWNNPEKDIMFPVAEKSKDNNLFGVGTNKGNIRLYSYPVDSNMVPYNEGSAHSTEVSSVSFLFGGGVFLSAGKNDYSIIQWKYTTKDASLPENFHVKHLRNSAGYLNDWRKYGDNDPKPPQSRLTGYNPTLGRPGPARRASIFKNEYVSKHTEAK